MDHRKHPYLKSASAYFKNAAKAERAGDFAAATRFRLIAERKLKAYKRLKDEMQAHAGQEEIGMKFKVGDRITFKAACRRPTRTVTRPVLRVNQWGWPEVNYLGWKNFMVRPSEVKKVEAGDGA